MGWSIGGGVKFTTNDIFEINTRIVAWRGIVRDMTRVKMIQLFADTIRHDIDVAMGRSKPIPTKPLSKAWNDMMEAQREIKRTQERNPRYDFEFALSILPFRGEIYGIVRCEHEEWRRKFMRSGLVKPFWWHDNERPSHVSATEWKERETLWKSLFDGDSRPVAHGFDADCSTSAYEVKRILPKEVMRAINKKTFEERVRTIAKDHVRFERVEADPELDRNEQGVSSYMHAMFKAGDWMKTDEGKAAIEQEYAVVEKLLLPVIDESVL